MADSDDSRNSRPRATSPRTPEARAFLNTLKHGRPAVNHTDLLLIDRGRHVRDLRSSRRIVPTAPQQRFVEIRCLNPCKPSILKRSSLKEQPKRTQYERGKSTVRTPIGPQSDPDRTPFKYAPSPHVRPTLIPTIDGNSMSLSRSGQARVNSAKSRSPRTSEGKAHVGDKSETSDVYLKM